MVGIDVIENREGYTSKCSALDGEFVGKHSTYMGQRKPSMKGLKKRESRTPTRQEKTYYPRGLFRSSQGLYINSDVNGAINIGRLAWQDGKLDKDPFENYPIKSMLLSPITVELEKYKLTQPIAKV